MPFNLKSAWLLTILLVLATRPAHADTADGCRLPDTRTTTESLNAFAAHKWRMADDKACLNSEVDLPADYFLLSLSYSPKFCAGHGDDPKNAFQCASGNNFVWVVHGLWAQAAHPAPCADDPGKLQHPRYCQGDNYPLIPAETVAQQLCVQPGVNLVETEWAKHGTCSGLSAADYLAKTRSLFQNLLLPDQDMQPPQIYRWMREHNAALARVRMDFDRGAHELRICYDRQFNYIDCP